MPEVKPVIKAGDVPGLDMSALFTNRFNITLGPAFARVALGEFVAGDPELDTRFHSAFIMPTRDLVEFAKLVLQLEQQILAATSSPPPPSRED